MKETKPVRKQIYITKEQDTFLKDLSQKHGLSVTDLIRRLIDDKIQHINRDVNNVTRTELEKYISDYIKTKLDSATDKLGDKIVDLEYSLENATNNTQEKIDDLYYKVENLSDTVLYLNEA